MTANEQQHDQWLTEIRAVLAETANNQRKLSAVLLELGQQVTRLLERWNDLEHEDIGE